MFSIGDKVVYPMHGAGTIESIEEKEMFGEASNYYIIKMPIGDMKLMVPTESAEDIGVREVSNMNITQDVFAILEKPKEEYVYENNWSRRYKVNIEKIKSGDIKELADVVRDLSHRHMERGLSTAEKKMLTQSKEILISELILSEGLDHQTIDTQIEDKIKFSFDIADSNTNDDTNIVENL